MKKISIIALGICVVFGVLEAQAQVTNTSNNVFIDQVGNSNTVTLTQAGAGNSIGNSSSDYATITGDSNSVTMTQTGDNNLAQYLITGNANTYTSIITGNGNQTQVTCGTADGACSSVTINQEITGNGNLLVETISGSNILSKTKVVGNMNDIEYDLKSSNGKLDVDISGDNNIMRHTQAGSAGVDGHNLIVTLAGSLNQVTTVQNGTIDTNININVNGSSNVISVLTGN